MLRRTRAARSAGIGALRRKKRMTTIERSTWATKVGLARMLAGGVIMDVVTADQARDRRGGGRGGGHGARAGAVRHPQVRRRRAHERPEADQRDQGGGQHPGHGQVPHRALRRGADPRGARGRLHRRVRGAHAGRRGAPHRQARLPGAVRVRLPRPRRGAAPHRRGGGHDPHQGRGRHRRHRRGRAPHAGRAEGDPPAPEHADRRAVRRGQGAARPVRHRQADGRAGRAARSRTSAPAASPRRRTPA